VLDSEAGFTALDLTYFPPEDSEQAIIESRGAPLSARKLRWFLWRLESAEHISEVFSPVARDFEVTEIKADDTTATVDGLTVVGTTLQLGRSAVSTFVMPARESALVFMRRGRLRDEPLPAFEELYDLSDAQAERRELQRRLAGGR